jgi:sec-independent protein translocase protein TatB
MFDIGITEILIVAVVALVVLGPERLPKAARMVGFWVRKARSQWYAVKAELESEMADEELKNSLKESAESMKHSLESYQSNLQNDLQDIEQNFQASAQDAAQQIAAEDIPPPASDKTL